MDSNGIFRKIQFLRSMVTCTGKLYSDTKLYVVVFVFKVPPTAKVIWRRGHGLKSHPTDW